jgi:bifunctional ADP-heptose synthase (sugar kinase/adenylyltransferase)
VVDEDARDRSLDTREKILTQAAAAATARRLQREGKPVKLATGYFDPMLAGHARRLEALRDDTATLMVVVADPPRPILPARARAELVAALRVVDYVVLPEGGCLEPFLTQLEAAEITRGEVADEELTRDLIRHVHTRQRAG